MTVGKNIACKKVKGTQYYLLYNTEALGMNIKWGKGDKKFQGRKSRF